MKKVIRPQRHGLYSAGRAKVLGYPKSTMHDKHKKAKRRPRDD